MATKKAAAKVEALEANVGAAEVFQSMGEHDRARAVHTLRVGGYSELADALVGGVVEGKGEEEEGA